MTYSCGCKGTAHDPDCWVLHPSTGMSVDVMSPQPMNTHEREVQRKLDRIIILLEELTRHRR